MIGAVVIDAFIVRLTLVPAVMLLIGDRIWWMPRWLDRILPNLDIKRRTAGHALRMRHPRWSIKKVQATHGPGA